MYDINLNFLRYQSIINAIKAYRNKYTCSKKLEIPCQTINAHILTQNSKGANILYNILNKNNERPTSIMKWNEIYQIKEKDWYNIFENTFRYNLSSELRWFQYRINNRFLPTQKYFFNIKVSNNSSCQYCKEIETIQHMLWECSETQEFLTKLLKSFKLLNTDISISSAQFVLNNYKSISQVELILLLETKYYIFLCKKSKKTLSVLHFKNKLKQTYNSLKYLAIRDNQETKFLEAWSAYHRYFTWWNKYNTIYIKKAEKDDPVHVYWIKN